MSFFAIMQHSEKFHPECDEAKWLGIYVASAFIC